MYELEFDNQVSLNFGMMLKTLIKLQITQLDFMEKRFGRKNLGDGPKTGIFEFIENVGASYKSRKIKN